LNKCYALIPAAGSGQRARTSLPKQYAMLNGQLIVARTLAALGAVHGVEALLVVLSPDDDQFETRVPQFAGARHWLARCGGSTRAESVLAGLHALCERGADREDWVLVHDAARCLVQSEWVERLMTACQDDAVGGLLALPLADTLKTERLGRSVGTVDRSDKWIAQTPQMFRIGMLIKALVQAGGRVTDEASAIEAAGHAPLLVPGDPRNLKITWPQDFELASDILSARELRGHVATNLAGREAP
jgi:2-C-methyl-D-erythritol 4-phosphate cytidylyltransferase